MNKLLFVLFTFLSICRCKVHHKFDVDVKNLKSIWESPEMKPVLKNLEKKVTRKSEPSSRILNGIPAQPGQFPFHVLLAIDMFYECGGSLIKPNWVLTVTIPAFAITIVFFIFFKGCSLHRRKIIRECLQHC